MSPAREHPSQRLQRPAGAHGHRRAPAV